MNKHQIITDLTAGWGLDYSRVSDKPIIDLLCDADRATTNEGYRLLRQTLTIEVKKDRSSAATQKAAKNLTISSITQDDTDYAYIFSKKVDKAIDNGAKYFLAFVMIYFAAHIVWSLVR